MSLLSVADRLFGAIEAGDIEAVRTLYAPDVVVWHNYDGVGQSGDENLAVLQWCVRHIAGMRYTDVQRHEIAGGFVEQHVLRGTAPNGEELAVPACLVVAVAGDRITRIDEYLDTGQLGALLGS